MTEPKNDQEQGVEEQELPEPAAEGGEGQLTAEGEGAPQRGDA